MIVHVSGREAMEQVALGPAARAARSCRDLPAIYHADGRRHEGPNMECQGAKYVCSPPPRDRKASRRSGKASPRACSRPSRPITARSATTTQGQADAERPHLVPLGAERHSGCRDPAADPVLRRRVEGPHQPQNFVELTATNHAKHLRPLSAQGLDRASASTRTSCCGTRTQETIWQADLHHGSDYTPWEGFDVTGWPVTTIARGRGVYEHGRIVGDKGAGDVLSRGRSSLI